MRVYGRGARRPGIGVCIMEKKDAFVWETHGIHAGTITGPIKHGIDDVDKAIERAIELGHPSVCFIIHTPRLTTFRYQTEESLGLKFIRGDSAFAGYVPLMEDYRKRYADRIDVRFGIELEWQGLGLGVTWSRAKIEQALGVDFIVGSVHFSKDHIAYDGSKDEARRLLELCGGGYAYWDRYLTEVLTMLDSWGPFIHVLGHLDLPKLNMAAPAAILDPNRGAGPLARKLHTILWKLVDMGIALDVNMSGEVKGCGAYPNPGILTLARELGVSICLGTDTHSLADIGRMHERALAYVSDLGFTQYLSFRGGRPQMHLVDNRDAPGVLEFERTLNAGLSIIAQMDNPDRRKVNYREVSMELGEGFSAFRPALHNRFPLGDGGTICLRKDGHSVLVGLETPRFPESFSGIYFKHRNKPGILALLVSILASEGINLDTAYLFNDEEGEGEAYFAVSAPDSERIAAACEFALGTNSESFLKIIPNYSGPLPSIRKSLYYIHALDDVELEMAPSSQMIYSVHEDKPGILFVLLAALAARGVNVLDLRLMQRPGYGHALLAVRGTPLAVQLALHSIRSEFINLSYLTLEDDELGRQ
jgi:HisJ family histidinol phosphate phosphatase